MGSDPKRLDGLSDDESFAALALEHITGGVARAHDVGRLQGAYDLDLLLPRGRVAAVEVTTVAGDGVRHREALLGPRSRGRARRPPRGADEGVDLPDVLPALVTELLLVPHVARRAAKVAGAVRVDERHLFVGIGRGHLGGGEFAALGRPVEGLPAADPDVEDDRLTDVWLTTSWQGAPLLRWSRTGGWAVHELVR
ncbi:hypothetical protein ACK8HX_16435 [Oryzobacter sp. R7]|uniref:hypothetical protein n=1 Tax=Oryzobacter faecalis TaxID=3388656 RepID=UPI00398D63A0